MPRSFHRWMGAVPVILLTAAVPAAARMEVLTAGKVIHFGQSDDPALTRAVVVVGRDRALRTLRDPRCPAGSAIEIEAYEQLTFRDQVLARVELECARWSARGAGFVYDDPSGTVRAITYTRSGLRIDAGGAGLARIDGPVAFLQAQLEVGPDILRARVYNFVRNDGQTVRSRRPSRAAALGEAGFWDVLLGDDASEAHQQETLAWLASALRRNPRDGRSHFLLAMLHLYRFGQRVVRFDEVSDDARAELVAAHTAFTAAVPLLWNDATEIGDSRVPGFAAAAKYVLGRITGDAALQAAGLADLDRAVAVNGFFNVFDYIPILQALPPSDPLFKHGFEQFRIYLEDPATLQCVAAQPEICGNAGFAPRNIQGALTLFGDVYAKAGNLMQAEFWYTLANAFPESASWTFAPVIQDRVATAADRVVRYADADPSNDPPLLGAGPEACAVCHRR